MDNDTIQKIQKAVSIIFPTLFHNIQCQTPYLQGNKLHIPFLWQDYPHREGKMVYDILSPTSVSLDAFSCSPLASLYGVSAGKGIEWIQLKYTTKSPEIAQFEKAVANIIGDPSHSATTVL